MKIWNPQPVDPPAQPEETRGRKRKAPEPPVSQVSYPLLHHSFLFHFLYFSFFPSGDPFSFPASVGHDERSPPSCSWCCLVFTWWNHDRLRGTGFWCQDLGFTNCNQYPNPCLDFFHSYCLFELFLPWIQSNWQQNFSNRSVTNPSTRYPFPPPRTWSALATLIIQLESGILGFRVFLCFSSNSNHNGNQAKFTNRWGCCQDEADFPQGMGEWCSMVTKRQLFLDLWISWFHP